MKTTYKYGATDPEIETHTDGRSTVTFTVVTAPVALDDDTASVVEQPDEWRSDVGTNGSAASEAD